MTPPGAPNRALVSGRSGSATEPGPLRGRATELARLDEVIGAAQVGASDMVVIEGAAGIGKSRLLAAACERAAREGLLVLAGSADELDQVSPWGPLLHALASSGEALLSLMDLGELQTMADQRLAVIERMRAALEAASGQQPLLVVVDDLQWADAATLLALGVLPGELFSYPVGWLLACRHVPSTPALAGLLARLDGAGAERLHIGPLGPQDAADLAADIAGPEPGPALGPLIAGAEGNPFYIIELARAVTAARRHGPKVVTPEVQATVRAAVVRHLRSLSDPGRHLLSVASVLGRDFSVAELAEMTGQPASQLLPALEEALNAEVFIESSGQLMFRHDLLRQAVYDGLPESLRLALHRDAAGALLRTGAPQVRVAGHLAIGARPGDAAAVTALADAARELLPTSPQAAASLASRALGLLGDPGAQDSQEETRHDLVLTNVHALVLGGQRTAAAELAEGYLARHTPSAPVEVALQLELRAAWVLERLVGYPSPLPQHLLTDPAVDAVALAAAVACEHVDEPWDGRGRQAAEALECAMAIVRGSGRAFEFSIVAFLQVVNSMLRGRMAEALSHAEAGLAAAPALEGPHSSGTHEALVAVALGANGRYAEALAMLSRSLAAAEATGRTYFIVQSRWLRSFQLLQLGRLQDAHAEARAAVDTANDFGYAAHRSHGLAILAETWLRQGQAGTARAALGQFGPAVETGSLPDRYWAAALVGDALGDQAEVAAALEYLATQLGLGCYATAISQHHRLPQLVKIALRAGDVTAVAAFRQAATSLAEQNPHVGSAMAADAHVQGIIQHDVELLREAVRRAAPTDSLLVEAAAREDLARLLPGPARQEAIAHLEAAYASYVRAGAAYDVARVRAALRSLGIRKRQTSIARPEKGWESLTDSERTVVALVARGATNREAAGELFLSPDTINTHLRHAFAKLGIRSRVELARMAAERDRPDTT
jgi:DNA-binding CsgD family transcriptional regulator